MVFFALFGVLIIPKWLIKVPGPIAIVNGPFWELPKISKFWTRSGPSPPVFITKTFQKIQEKIWAIFVFFLFFYGIFGPFWGFNYSKMAN